MSRRSRGYDSEYDHNRAALLRRVRELLDTGYPVVCVLCGQALTLADKITAEHITALRYGGSNDPSNLGPAHARCNYAWRLNRGKR